jgi:hypothetical protein
LIEADGSIVPRKEIPSTFWKFLRIDEEGDYILLRDKHRWQALKFDTQGLRRHFPSGQPVEPERQEAPQSKPSRPKRRKRVEDAVVKAVLEIWPSGEIPPIPAKKRNSMIRDALKAKGIEPPVSDSTIQRALRRPPKAQSPYHDRI